MMIILLFVLFPFSKFVEDCWLRSFQTKFKTLNPSGCNNLCKDIELILGKTLGPMVYQIFSTDALQPRCAYGLLLRTSLNSTNI